MKKFNHQARRCAVLLAVLLAASPLAACDDSSSQTQGDNSTAESSTVNDNSSTADANESSEKSKKDDSSSKKDSPDSKKSDESSSGMEQSGDESSVNDDESSVSDNQPSGGDDSQGGASDSKPAEQNSKSGSESWKDEEPAQTTEGPPNEDDDDEPKVKETKYIYLEGNSAKYNGTGIYVSGSTIIIEKGGIYEISGTLNNGQILIKNGNKKVYLNLNGCDITNNAGSAINCQQAKKLTVTTLPGTVNTLADGGTHDLDKGTIFSEDTVILEGEGTLNITANYAHGIQSDDDIIVNSGTINIVSAKSGLHSNDGIDINGGKLFCDGGTNGIKTDGYININGGESIFLGGTREEKGAVYCDGTFTVNGGTFYAIGNTCTTPDPSVSTATVIGAVFTQPKSGGTMVQFAGGGNTVAAFTSPRGFKYALYAGGNLTQNTDYTVSYGGSVSGGSEENYVTYGGTYSGGTDGGTFNAGSSVTMHSIAG